MKKEIIESVYSNLQNGNFSDVKQIIKKLSSLDRLDLIMFFKDRENDYVL